MFFIKIIIIVIINKNKWDLSKTKRSFSMIKKKNEKAKIQSTRNML